jgi:hypothetical protein
MLAKEKAMEQAAAPKDGVKRTPVRIIAEIAGHLGKPMEWWTSEAEGPVEKVKAALKEVADKKVAAKKGKKKAAYLINLTKTPQELKDIPYVRGAVTWSVAHRYAKKLGRDDVAQVRSDLAQRKKLPK